jgi:Cu/Ag efflux protein CusF
MNKKLTTFALALAVAFPLASVAQKKAEVAGGAVTAPGKAGAAAVVTAQGVIEAVDPKTREVKIKLANGETRTIVAGEEVRNFDQIKVGDKLNVKYLESATIELKKGGKAVVARTESSTMERAKPGEKPGGVATREIKVVSDVVAVDEKAKKVSVKNDKGEVVSVDVRDPEQLKLIKKGDQVEVTYIQAVAISLEAAAPAKKDAAPAKK